MRAGELVKRTRVAHGLSQAQLAIRAGTTPRTGERGRPQATDPRRIFETFERHGVDYIVIGGIAAIAHGSTRNTRDVDFVASTDRPNPERPPAALRDLDARLSDTDAHLLGIDVHDPETLGSGANFTMETDAGGLDFFNDVPGAAPYDQLRDR